MRMTPGLKFISWLVAHRNPTCRPTKEDLSGYDAQKMPYWILAWQHCVSNPTYGVLCAKPILVWLEKGVNERRND